MNLSRRTFLAAVGAVTVTGPVSKDAAAVKVDILQPDGTWKYAPGGLRQVRYRQTFRQYNSAGTNVTLTAVASEDGHAVMNEAGLVCGGVSYFLPNESTGGLIFRRSKEIE